ncbi:N-acetylmuramoyl-L-alanine amidase family protein [Streptococcus sp. 3874]|uniref:N-acetylmuramoyl-L-alanine amidase family protein n=1 Tax=Streptococcus sp. 3874 TaxID=2582685 RepID=UPI001562CC4F
MKKVLLTSAVALAAFGAVQAVSADTATFSEANVQTLPNAKPAADERTEPSAEVSKLFKEAAEAAEAAAKRGEEASGKVNTTENGDLTIDDIKSHLASQQSNKQRVVTDRYVKVYDKEGNELKLDGKAVEIKYEKSANSTVEVKTKRGTYKLTVRVQNGKATLLKTPQLVASAETPAQKAEWIKSGSRWWYKHADGSYTTNGWEKINGTWYYFDQAGWMTTGWVKDNGTWYYLKSSGAMATGWYQVGGKWYYSYASGALAVNTTVDGYKVNHNGEWVK